MAQVTAKLELEMCVGHFGVLESRPATETCHLIVRAANVDTVRFCFGFLHVVNNSREVHSRRACSQVSKSVEVNERYFMKRCAAVVHGKCERCIQDAVRLHGQPIDVHLCMN